MACALNSPIDAQKYSLVIHLFAHTHCYLPATFLTPVPDIDTLVLALDCGVCKSFQVFQLGLELILRELHELLAATLQ